MTTVAVVGTGLLGCGIAKVVARAGHPVTLHDASAASLAAAHAAVSDSADAVSVRAEPELERAVRDVAVVIEAVIEDLGLKQRLFSRMSEVSPHAVLMSNSSVLPISRIAERTVRAERAVGTHWWNPPHLIPVVEVIRGQETSEAVVEQTTAFLAGLGKIPVRVERDLPGFIGNRLQHALWREALSLVSDGLCPAAEVDRIVAATLGVRLAERGPMAEMRHAGLDRVAEALASTVPLLNSDPRPCRLLRSKVSAGQLGSRSGQGFLAWPAGARERAAARLQHHLERRLEPGMPREPAQSEEMTLTDEERALARRLSVAVWREALTMVAGGVCSAEMADLVATNTIGLRLAVMGPVENADYVGLDLTLAIHEAVLPSLDASTDVPTLLELAAGRLSC